LTRKPKAFSAFVAAKSGTEVAKWAVRLFSNVKEVKFE
jgi:hypothetical protein